MHVNFNNSCGIYTKSRTNSTIQDRGFSVGKDRNYKKLLRIPFAFGCHVPVVHK